MSLVDSELHKSIRRFVEAVLADGHTAGSDSLATQTLVPAAISAAGSASLADVQALYNELKDLYKRVKDRVPGPDFRGRRNPNISRLYDSENGIRAYFEHVQEIFLYKMEASQNSLTAAARAG